MNTMKRVGFFKELADGDKNETFIKEIIGQNTLDKEPEIINYLNNGKFLCITPGVVCDVLDESKGVIGSLEILTDGEWIWPSDLSNYLQNYHIKLDEQLIDHIKKNNWKVPDVDINGGIS